MMKVCNAVCWLLHMSEAEDRRAEVFGLENVNGNENLCFSSHGTKLKHIKIESSLTCLEIVSQ